MALPVIVQNEYYFSSTSSKKHIYVKTHLFHDIIIQVRLKKARHQPITSIPLRKNRIQSHSGAGTKGTSQQTEQKRRMIQKNRNPK